MSDWSALDLLGHLQRECAHTKELVLHKLKGQPSKLDIETKFKSKNSELLIGRIPST